jgi:hypothetical protein
MTNRYPACCSKCSVTVPANGGTLRKVGRKWEVTHLTCEGAAPNSEPRVVEFRFSSGAVVTRNRRGKCVDAPCCGCCSG